MSIFEKFFGGKKEESQPEQNRVVEKVVQPRWMKKEEARQLAIELLNNPEIEDAAERFSACSSTLVSEGLYGDGPEGEAYKNALEEQGKIVEEHGLELFTYLIKREIAFSKRKVIDSPSDYSLQYFMTPENIQANLESMNDEEIMLVANTSFRNLNKGIKTLDEYHIKHYESRAKLGLGFEYHIKYTRTAVSGVRRLKGNLEVIFDKLPDHEKEEVRDLITAADKRIEELKKYIADI